MNNKSLREKEQRPFCVIILQTYINVVNANVEHLAHTHGCLLCFILSKSATSKNSHFNNVMKNSPIQACQVAFS